MAEEAEETDRSDKKIILRLNKPIMAHGEEIKEISCREPTARDIMDIGNPVHVEYVAEEDKSVVTINDKRMGLMISRLGEIPPSSVRSMATRDFAGAAWVLQNFFLPG